MTYRAGLLTYLEDDPSAAIETIGVIENPVYDGAEFDQQETFSYPNEEKEPGVSQFLARVDYQASVLITQYTIHCHEMSVSDTGKVEFVF